MTFWNTVFGKNWLDFLVSEPKDSPWSYGVTKIFLIVITLTTLLYMLRVAYQPSPNVLDIIALLVSFGMALGLLIVSEYESSHEKSKGIGMALVGTPINLLVGVIAGLGVTALLVIFLATSFCSTPRLIEEGYCVGPVGAQQFVLPSQSSILAPELAEPFYSVFAAPVTEELFFRVFLFYSGLAIADYFFFTKNLKKNYPILFFLLLAIIVNSPFGYWHYERAHALCPEGNEICLFDRMWVSNFYGMVWLGGNQLTGGIGFSVVGHILNNFISTKPTFPDFFLYVVVPMVVLWLLVSVAMQSANYLFKKRGKK